MEGRGGRTPLELLTLTPDEADAELERLERTVPVRPSLLELGSAVAQEAIVFGDTHGDWRSTEAAVGLWRAEGPPRYLIGLGDYVDRAPTDCGEGSVANALYLLGLTSRYPDRVILVQGNHETTARIPALPHDLPEEVDQLWGPDSSRYSRLVGLLERGPFAVTLPNRTYLAHAGFPRPPYTDRWQASFDSVSDDQLLDLVWSGCEASESRRNADPRFGAVELEQFFRATGLAAFVRGHDPDLAGRWVFRNRCLTLQTTRLYQQLGGVVVARIRTDLEPVAGSGVVLEHLATEGRSFPRP